MMPLRSHFWCKELSPSTAIASPILSPAGHRYLVIHTLTYWGNCLNLHLDGRVVKSTKKPYSRQICNCGLTSFLAWNPSRENKQSTIGHSNLALQRATCTQSTQGDSMTAHPRERTFHTPYEQQSAHHPAFTTAETQHLLCMLERKHKNTLFPHWSCLQKVTWLSDEQVMLHGSTPTLILSFFLIRSLLKAHTKNG